MTTHPETFWEIPEPQSTVDVPVDNDTRITLRRHGNPEGPRLVLSHGNGLAIDLYFPFWSLLLDDFDLFVYDLRNHGWNTVSSLHEHSVPTFVNDHDCILEAIDLHFGKKTKIGVFHSVSALTALLSPARGGGFGACVLFDPPLCRHGDSYEEFDAAAERVAAMTRRRANRFETTEEFAEVLPYLPTFQRVAPGVFELVARTTLRRSANGQVYELRCPREYEAQIVDYAATFAVLVDFPRFQCPIKVIGADPTLPYSYLPTLDLSDIVTVDYDFLPETTHLLQMEQPAECVDAMREFLESQSLI
ncbi:MAG: alpha/beta hydrolase [Candidatus Latescibacteria bacterium]|nr:alpha/beta hydrolase [Candidatus Latescibacterota bacterium]